MGIVAPRMDIVDRHLITVVRDASLLPELVLPPPPRPVYALPLRPPPRLALRRQRLRPSVQTALAGQQSRAWAQYLGIAVLHMDIVDRELTTVGRDASLLLEPALLALALAPQTSPLLRRPRNQRLVPLRPLLHKQAQRRPRLSLLVRMVLAGQHLHARDLPLETVAPHMGGADRRLIIAGRDASLLLVPALPTL